MGLSLHISLLDIVQMEVFSVSDSVHHPLVDYLVSRRRWTQIGKLLPWGKCCNCHWSFFLCAVSSAFRVPWYLTIIFHECMTSFLILSISNICLSHSAPYTSLNMFLGGDQQDRDSNTHTERLSVEALAMLMATVIQGQVLWVFNKDRDEACLNEDQEPDLPHSTAQRCTKPYHNNTYTPHCETDRNAFMISALVMRALFFGCCMVLFLGVKEQKDWPHSVHMHTTHLNALKKLTGHLSFQCLVLGFLCSTLAFQGPGARSPSLFHAQGFASSSSECGDRGEIDGRTDVERCSAAGGANARVWRRQGVFCPQSQLLNY
ncbi:unnamed protein product [Leuciscus chuanchicus]